MNSAQQGRGGFALLAVLALILPLAALAAALTAFALNELRVVGYTKASVEAEVSADAGVHETIAGLLGRLPAMATAPDGVWRSWRRPGGTLRVRVTDEAGRIALNAASPALLACALAEAGLTDGEAGRVMTALRGGQKAGSGASMEGKALSVGSLSGTPGMTTQAFARLADALTVHSKQERPNRLQAPSFVLRTLDRCPESAGPGSEPEPDVSAGKPKGPALVRIEAVAVLDRARYSRLAVVDLASDPPAILAWRLGPMPTSAGP